VVRAVLYTYEPVRVENLDPLSTILLSFSKLN
jgi:hypothetical protein